MRLPISLFLGCFAIFVGACSSSAPTCADTFTPCGGSLVGTWSFELGCNVSNLDALSCAGVTSTVSPLASGTYTFKSDGSYALDVTDDETGTLVYPASCLGGFATCSAINSTSTSGGVTVTTTCTGTVAESCTCAVTVTGAVTDTGTYTTAGTDFTTTSTTTGVITAPAGYCASGSQLELAGGVMGAGSAGVYTLFTRL